MIKKIWEKIDQYIWGVVMFILGYMFRGIINWFIQLPLIGKFFKNF